MKAKLSAKRNAVCLVLNQLSTTPLPLYPEERAPNIKWIGGWVGPGTGLGDMEKHKQLISQGLEL
jgi:hypothetical protein